MEVTQQGQFTIGPYDMVRVRIYDDCCEGGVLDCAPSNPPAIQPGDRVVVRFNLCARTLSMWCF